MERLEIATEKDFLAKLKHSFQKMLTLKNDIFQETREAAQGEKNLNDEKALGD